MLLTPAAASQGEFLRNLRVQVEITNSGHEPSRDITLEIPLLAVLDSPAQVVRQETFSHQPVAIHQQDDSRTMTVDIPLLLPGRSETIAVDYVLEFREVRNAPRYRASQLVAARIHAFVVGHMEYNSDSPYRNMGAIAALRHGEGVCEDFAALFVYLCRAVGIPARMVYGYADPAIFQQEGTLSLHTYRHAWVEFYTGGKWLPADPAFRYFGSLPFGDRIAKYYHNQAIQGRYQGGQLSIKRTEQLTGGGD